MPNQPPLTTSQAAARLDYTPARVRQLAAAGAFPGAYKAGRDWLIPAAAVASYRRPGMGRPKKLPEKSARTP